jgi:hypothetical protein
VISRGRMRGWRRWGEWGVGGALRACVLVFGVGVWGGVGGEEVEAAVRVGRSQGRATRDGVDGGRADGDLEAGGAAMGMGGSPVQDEGGAVRLG